MSSWDSNLPQQLTVVVFFSLDTTEVCAWKDDMISQKLTLTLKLPALDYIKNLGHEKHFNFALYVNDTSI